MGKRKKRMKRREFIKTGMGFLASVGFVVGAVLSGARWVYARTEKILLPRGTKRQSLIYKDPASLDTRNLETTNLKDFRTMGLSDHEVDLDQWRLEVTGRVKKPQRLTYPEVLSLPSLEKKVLLICPGVFVNHGVWKGVHMKNFLEWAGVDSSVKQVTFSGPKGNDEKSERFPIGDVLSNKVFLAYEVNGQPLPRKHGFPLRIVAEGYYGDDWVKYVDTMILEKG